MATTTDVLNESAEKTAPTPAVKPGVLFKTGSTAVTIRQRFTHEEANLEFLDCVEYELPAGSVSGWAGLPSRESLFWMWKGSVEIELRDKTYNMANYDTLYVPRGCEYRLKNTTDTVATVLQTSAPANNVHPVFHSSFAEFSQRQDRIRHLKGKIVYLMFDVSESADKLIAGYTFYDPYTRAWPPHNHTDQEETYIFIKGRGAMEVYETPETLSFVHTVNEGDLVTIPYLNYHPVFSQEEPLQFIWCIAGERYWVGDKNKDFMKGTGPAITT